VALLVVEQREPHAGRMAFRDVAQPATLAERCALARRIRDELEVPLPILVDGMDDASRALFSDLPAPAFVLDAKGTIVDKLPWADPEPLAASMDIAAGATGRRDPPLTWMASALAAVSRIAY
jgi:hypothetical protein